MGKLTVKKRYATTPNHLLNDNRISFKAKGIWTFLQSKPDGWNFSTKRISLESNDGISSVRAGLQELEEFGYLYRKPIKIDGRYSGYDYTILEFPLSENQTMENQTSGNYDTFSNKDISNKDFSNKDINSSENKPLELPFNSIDFVKKWAEWNEYRKFELKKPYKSRIGEQRALSHCEKLSAGNESIAIEILDQSMGNGWQGLFELKKSEKLNNQKKHVIGRDDPTGEF